jgi:5-methylcytosine-specific restriction endonuclease McrA
LARRIPQWVKDIVWARDGGSCSYPRAGGGRCGARGGLEFDHIVPWALGGPSDDPKNIRLLCRGHNQEEARRLFGGA